MKKAILTIDDMPQENTVAMIDYLLEKEIRPYFFAIGEKAEKRRDVVIYAIKKGLIVGNHTYSHPNLAEIPFEEGIAEIEKTEEILNEIYAEAGFERRMKLFRFPYLSTGGENEAEYMKYLREHGFSRIDDSDVTDKNYHENGWDRNCHVSCSFDCCEYMIRPGNDFTIEDTLKRIDIGFSGDEPGTHVVLLHSHDETEEMAPLYYKTIVERMLHYEVKFV